MRHKGSSGSTRGGMGAYLAVACILAMVVGIVHAGVGHADAGGDLPRACPAGEVPPSGFPDVSARNVHGPSIDCLAWSRHRVIHGRSNATYGPSEEVSRGQMAAFLVRAIEAAGAHVPSAPLDRFPHDPGTVFATNIDQLAEMAIASGVGPGRFDPDRPVTRAQLATFLVEAWEAASGIPLSADRDRFSDDDGSIHENSINRAASAGLTAGRSPGQFAPDNHVHRDEMATFLARFLDGVLATTVLSQPVTTDAGFLFVGGAYVAPPYTVSSTADAVFVNEQIVRGGTPPPGDGASDDTPEHPRDAVDLVTVAAARLKELGGSGPGVPDDAVVQDLIDLLHRYDITEDVEVTPAGLTVSDVDDGRATLLLRTREVTGYAAATALHQEAQAISALLAGGGVLLVTGGDSVSVPPQRAARFLHDLTRVYELPEPDREPAMVQLVASRPLTSSLLAAGDPRSAIGSRMPPEPPDDPATSATSADAIEGQSTGLERKSANGHRMSRTPGDNRAFLFTPVTIETPGMCFTKPVEEAARLHGYTVYRFDGYRSTFRDLVAWSNNMGILFTCMHGGQSFEPHRDAASARAARAEYTKQGLTGLFVGTTANGDWHVLGSSQFISNHWKSNNTIVFMDACTDLSYAAAYNAREFVGSSGNCIADTITNKLYSAFWRRLDGRLDAGEARNVRDAFDRTFPGTLQARIKARIAAGVKPKAARESYKPYELKGHGGGLTVLSPGVRAHAPSGAVAVGSTVRGSVQFDAAIASPLVARAAVVASGPCAGDRTGSGGVDNLSRPDPYSFTFDIRAAAEGPLTFTVDPLWVRSLDARNIRLDGNTRPARSDHVGPNGDPYVWTVQCVGSATQPPPSTAPSDPESGPSSQPTSEPADPSPQPTDGATTAPPSEPADEPSPTPSTEPTEITYVLVRQARSIQVGPLPADGIAVEPDKAAYASGEHVVLTAPESFTSDGYRHFFSHWMVDPDAVPYAVNDNVLSLTMNADVTATAYYESTPE